MNGSHQIQLTKGKFAIVDYEDYIILSKFNWHCVGGRYAARSVGGRDNKKMEYLHRVVAGAGDGDVVDHINGNPLDNRRSNLRVGTQQQNIYNQSVRKNNKSGYRGVAWQDDAKKWEVRIHKEGTKHYLGLFKCKHDAARVYNFWAHDLYGEYAKLNVINEEAI
jgi:hypothetical protein